MKKLWVFGKTCFRLFKCLQCAHNKECPYSIFVMYKGAKYVVTVEKKDGD